MYFYYGLIEELPSAGSPALVNGWQNNAIDAVPRPPAVRIAAPPALALTPATLPPKIAGMAWFERPDRDRPPTRITVEAPPAIALTPSTLPPKISGMAWFAPRPFDVAAKAARNADAPALAFVQPRFTFSFSVPEISLPRRPSFDTPPAFARPLSQPVPISMAWFGQPDRDRPGLRISGESQPAIALSPPSLPTTIAGIAWFEPPPDRVQIVVRFQPAPAFARAPDQLIGVAWQQVPESARALRRPISSEPPPLPAVSSSFVGYSYSPLDSLFPRRRPFDAPPALGNRQLFVPISGVAWFAPPDRDRPSLKVKGEAPPAIALTPSTLPPKISGMAWFSPLFERLTSRLGFDTPSSLPLLISGTFGPSTLRLLSIHGAMPPAEFGTVLPDGNKAPSKPSIDGTVTGTSSYRKLTDKGALEN